MIPILCGNDISLLLFYTESGEGSSFLCEIENVWPPVSHIWTNRFKKNGVRNVVDAHN